MKIQLQDGLKSFEFQLALRCWWKVIKEMKPLAIVRYHRKVHPQQNRLQSLGGGEKKLK